MSDKPSHPLVPPRSEYFICEGYRDDWSFRVPRSNDTAFGRFVSLAESSDGFRPYIAAMACFEWSHNNVSQFKFEEYGPFLDFLKTQSVDVMELNMWQRQQFGDDFKDRVCEQWALWSRGEPWDVSFVEEPE